MIFDAKDVLTPQLIGALIALGLLALVPVVVKRLRARSRAIDVSFELLLQPRDFRAWRKSLKPDICVIGGGSGGLSVAAAAAAFGVPVVLIERHKMGGDCLNTGCVPSKALLAAAKRAAVMRSARAVRRDRVRQSMSISARCTITCSA